MFNGNTVGYVAGTSCAAPTFSGVISLLNDLRLNAGMFRGTRRSLC